MDKFKNLIKLSLISNDLKIEKKMGIMGVCLVLNLSYSKNVFLKSEEKFSEILLCTE
jgi:hypothetical protein